MSDPTPDTSRNTATAIAAAVRAGERRAVDVLYLTDQRGRPLDASMTGRVIAALMDAAAT